MNKFGIKLYGDDDLIIDKIHYCVNSIKYFNYKSEGCKIRYINYNIIGINLYILNKKFYE